VVFQLLKPFAPSQLFPAVGFRQALLVAGFRQHFEKEKKCEFRYVTLAAEMAEVLALVLQMLKFDKPEILERLFSEALDTKRPEG